MRIILTGYTGHMGREVRTCAEAADHCEIVAGVDPMIPASEGICKKSFDECTAEADVILAVGLRSNNSLYGEICDEIDEVYMAGDCVKPAKVFEAVNTAYKIAEEL